MQAFRVRVGDQVSMGELLVDFEDAAAGAA